MLSLNMRRALVSAASAALAFSSVRAMEYEITSCDDFADVDDQIATGLTITSDEIACDTYTRFRVRNTMTVTAAVDTVTFKNFSLKVLGNLTVEPNVVFQDVEDAPTRGGALYVQLDASATFEGTAHFEDLSVAEQEIDGVYINKKGGAIHNKGYLVFEGDASFIRCEERTIDSTNEGYGGGISNHKAGEIIFKGKLTMEDNDADGFFEGEGGAINNRGMITVEGEAYFRDNTAGQGGAIAQKNNGKIVFNSFATFFDNTCFEFDGGAIANYGGDIEFNAGVLFEENGADSSGEGGVGGGIYHTLGGVVTFVGSTTFRDNIAGWGGAIFHRVTKPPYIDEDDWETPIINYPEDLADLVFEDNRANLYCPDVATGFGEEYCVEF